MIGVVIRLIGLKLMWMEMLLVNSYNTRMVMSLVMIIAIQKMNTVH